MVRVIKIDQALSRLEDERDTIKIQISLLKDKETPTSTRGTLREAQERLALVEQRIAAHRRLALQSEKEES